MKTFQPKLYNVAAPAGFDLEISHIQSYLAQLTFMDTVFGRAHIQEKLLSASEAQNAKNPALGLRGRDLYTRRWYQGRKIDQDIDLTLSDQYASMAYFYAADPIKIPKDWTMQQAQVEVSQPFNLVFWCSLNKLQSNPGENVTGEMLKTAIVAQLNQMNNLVVTNLYEGYDNILQDITVTNNLMQFCRYPYYALRIQAVSTFPMFPENGNGTFDPATLIDNSRTPVINQPGATNIN